MRVAAVLHPYAQDKQLEPFRAEGVNLFRGNAVERNDVPEAVIVFGGDGSVHRVLQALAGTQCPLLVVPTGSGNDFADSIGVTSVKHALQAWRRFVAGEGNVRTIDVGVINPLTDTVPVEDSDAVPVRRRTFAREDGSFERPPEQLSRAVMRSHLKHLYDAITNETYFGCVCGAGIDSDTNRRANAMPAWLRAHGGYVIGALRSLMSYEQQVMRVSLLDDDGTFRTRIEEKALLVAVGNAPSYGCGMKIAPKAQLDDGMLDVCFVREVSRPRVLRCFNTIYSGKHLDLPEVEYFRAGHLWLESEKPLAIYADGEYVCDTPAEIRVLRGALRVIIP